MFEETDKSIITMLDENGEEIEFEVLDTFLVDDEEFCAVTPRSKELAEALIFSGGYLVYKLERFDEELELREIDDVQKLREVAQAFEEHYNEILFG